MVIQKYKKTIENRSEKLSDNPHFFEPVYFFLDPFIYSFMGPGHHASLHVCVSSLGLQAVQANHVNQKFCDCEQEFFFFLFNRFVGLCLELF
jgi:hypothetical protein